MNLLPEEEVRTAFRFAFGREPRDVDIQWHRRHPSFDALREVFMGTPEFALRCGRGLDLGGQPVAIELQNGLSIWLPPDDLYVSPSIAKGAWEPAETAFLLRTIGRGAAVLDIGAMVGWFTLHAADAVGPSGAVYAFEPQANICRLLRRSVLQNRLEQIVAVHEMALSDNAGTVWLHQTTGEPSDRGRNLGHTWISDTPRPQNFLDVGKASSVRLDDIKIRRKIDFVKLDVEGAECQVLRGGEATIRQSLPTIMCELYPHMLQMVGGTTGEALIELLESWAYKPFALLPDGNLKPWEPSFMPSGDNGYTTVVFRI